MIAGLILAAGESSRMGTDKALLPYCGRTFLEHIVAQLRLAGVTRIVVVLGHHAGEIEQAVGFGDAQVVVNPDYRRGQTSSLQAGLEALAAEPVDAVLLCLVDHPAVEASTIGKLLDAFRDSSAPVVIPTHQGRRGHPVLISRQLFEELRSLGASEGANTAIRNHQAATAFVEVDDPGILTDIDDPESYRSLRAASEGRVFRPASKRKNR